MKTQNIDPIRALQDIGEAVKTGDFGGYVESYANLSFEAGDKAWIFNDAMGETLDKIAAAAASHKQRPPSPLLGNVTEVGALQHPGHIFLMVAFLILSALMAHLLHPLHKSAQQFPLDLIDDIKLILIMGIEGGT